MENDFELPSRSELTLSCPQCGETLGPVPDNDLELICVGEHTFTLGALLMGQSMRSAALIEAGKRLLQEQVNLVRAISSQIWVKRPNEAAKLDHQMDLLEEKITLLDDVMAPGKDPGEDDGL